MLKWMHCKKRSCINEATIGQIYCSAECAPLGFWRLWEEPFIEEATSNTDKCLKSNPEIRNIHYEDPTAEWEEREEYFEWNSRN